MTLGRSGKDEEEQVVKVEEVEKANTTHERDVSAIDQKKDYCSSLSQEGLGSHESRLPFTSFRSFSERFWMALSVILMSEVERKAKGVLSKLQLHHVSLERVCERSPLFVWGYS